MKGRSRISLPPRGGGREWGGPGAKQRRYGFRHDTGSCLYHHRFPSGGHGEGNRQRRQKAGGGFPLRRQDGYDVGLSRLLVRGVYDRFARAGLGRLRRNRPTQLTGATGAGRVWARFVNDVRPWIHPQPFRMVPGVVQRIICASTGQLATVACREEDRGLPGRACAGRLLHGSWPPVDVSLLSKICRV